MDSTGRERLEAAIREAEKLQHNFEATFATLGSSDLTAYKERGWITVRSIVPNALASVLRDYAIHPGMKLHERALDAEDPRTWGPGGITPRELTWFERLLTTAGAESEYYGARLGFGRSLEKRYRPELGEADLALLQKAWNLANNLASRRFRSVMDELVGVGEWNDDSCTSGAVMPTFLHVRYGLPAKDLTLQTKDFKWPSVGWHMDGAWHLHLLGRWIESSKAAVVTPELAGVALVTWDDLLPHGGATGVIPGSHRGNMQTVLAATESGGISNIRILITQSLFGSRAVDPVAEEAAEQVLHPGDAIIMHPYLTHSSSWNYQHKLRLGTHLMFRYREPMDVQGILEMRQRQLQANDPKSAQQGRLPPNTELYAEVLEGYATGLG